jgi:hypothetical protein
MVTEDDSFKALGKRRGHTNTGFWTSSTKIENGGFFAGTRNGAEGVGEDGYGVKGEGYGDDGVIGESHAGGLLLSAGEHGVRGTSVGWETSGVYGEHKAFESQPKTPTRGFGVCGTSEVGPGVRGESIVDSGVEGESHAAGKSGVFGKGLLGAAGVLGLGIADVGIRGVSITRPQSLVNEAKDGVAGETSNAGRSGVWGNNTGSGFGVAGTSIKNHGVKGTSSGDSKSGVFGLHDGRGIGVGVIGASEEGSGVHGACRSTTAAGVEGYNIMTSGEGEFAQTTGPGVYGQSRGGPGVEGYSRNDAGVVGNSRNGLGVFGMSETTIGIRGFSNNSSGVQGSSTNGTGVHGTSSNNYGGQFQGGLANLYLMPMSTKGPPESGDHRRGELLVDSDGVLFFCTRSGAPGTWKRVQLV